LLYFAYGSNLLPARLLARTPSARVVAVGRLPGHRLCWHMASSDGSGKCDVVAEAAANVHGAVWRLDPADKPALDAAESLGHGYSERRMTVHTPAGPLEAWTYLALRTDPARRPYRWYRDIVAAGARHHALPADYVAALEAIEAVEDPDPLRDAHHRRLLAG
jgi:gamma-glutamylcyclotransferase